MKTGDILEDAANAIKDLRAEIAQLRRNDRRYKLAREHIVPSDLSRRLGLTWTDIPKNESIEEHIDWLFDAALNADPAQAVPPFNELPEPRPRGNEEDDSTHRSNRAKDMNRRFQR